MATWSVGISHKKNILKTMYSTWNKATYILFSKKIKDPSHSTSQHYDADTKPSQDIRRAYRATAPVVLSWQERWFIRDQVILIWNRLNITALAEIDMHDVNHLGMINITASIKSSADLGLVFCITRLAACQCQTQQYNDTFIAAAMNGCYQHQWGNHNSRKWRQSM